MYQETFFTKDRDFYKSLLPLFLMVALQNLVAYSVNMADNMMLGHYSQAALNGATTVNSIFFIVQQIALSIGEALVVLASQYWGERRLSPVRRVTGIAVKLAFICGVAAIAISAVMPSQLIAIFTQDAAVISEGVVYLSIIKYTFLLFLLTNVLMAALRSVEIVKISFGISLVSLIINVAINYTLIFGRFGFPEMGIKGAAIGTLIARVVEFMIVIIFLWKKDTRLKLFSENFLKFDRQLRTDYRKVFMPVLISQILWAVSIPIQTGILGRLSSNALAANSVATTFYQYLKVVVQAMSLTSAVMIGKAVGEGIDAKVREDARTLSVLSLVVGIILGLILFALRMPLLTIYSGLSPEALKLADQLIILMCFVMVGMSYQMPVSAGIMRGAGDVKFMAKMNLICIWFIVMPLSFMAAFWWKLPVVWVVLCIQSDQVFKSIPVFVHFKKHQWIKKRTQED